MAITYDKYPKIPIKGYNDAAWQGYGDISRAIREKLRQKNTDPNKHAVIVVECYPAVREREIVEGLKQHLNVREVIHAEAAAKSAEELQALLDRYLTDDRVFGYMAPFTIDEFYHESELAKLRRHLESIRTDGANREDGKNGVILVIGFGASLVTKGDILVYADLARWEIQQRYRSKEFGNWRANNHDEDILRKYKRGFFVEWRTADRLKRELLPGIDFYLDTNKKDDPKMVTREALFAGFDQTVSGPFRLVPYFDPGVWGGYWMQEKIGLEEKEHPYAWAFDGVAEENSLYYLYGNIQVELPSINVVFFRPAELLGPRVYARFGAEFPIRFDFLDTMGGGNLSLQVHPLTDYIRNKFGMTYTQDESYYLLDAADDAVVYLGLKEGINPEEMIADLKKAQEGGFSFPAEKYIHSRPARKHDHFLIPAGTIHCSGTNSMVLEISATPYIFTFKLWDWDRLGLDGKPRPVHLEHGVKNIQWDRTSEWVEKQLVNRIEIVDQGKGWIEERTGLHELEFIETRRHWFTEPVTHTTHGSVNMLNLVEGDEAEIISPTGAFEPFVVHYAETFIIPAAVESYVIRPTARSKGQKLATIKAFVKK